mmetsp:Transcript_22280/g.88438  ORF Transcript_22280/g.88438 Transcript_22280/m.88438 type:complete len:211 (+) Transcript_22280:159-791(+)
MTPVSTSCTPVSGARRAARTKSSASSAATPPHGTARHPHSPCGDTRTRARPTSPRARRRSSRGAAGWRSRRRGCSRVHTTRSSSTRSCRSCTLPAAGSAGTSTTASPGSASWSRSGRRVRSPWRTTCWSSPRATRSWRPSVLSSTRSCARARLTTRLPGGATSRLSSRSTAAPCGAASCSGNEDQACSQLVKSLWLYVHRVIDVATTSSR